MFKKNNATSVENAFLRIGAKTLCALSLGGLLHLSSAFAATPQLAAKLASTELPEYHEAPTASRATPSTAQEDIADLTILSDNDIALYREVFRLQQKGDWRSADQKIRRISDPVLMGYVQYQRYMHPTKYRSTYKELRTWMANYADVPGANKIYKLALRKKPARTRAPKRPALRKWRIAPSHDLHPDLVAAYKKTGRIRVKRIENRVRSLSKKERAMQALREIERHHNRRTITKVQLGRMKSWIASSLFYQGYPDSALRIANEAIDQAGDSAVLAHWISGLIDFGNHDMVSAHAHFSAAAAIPYQSDALRAANAFWAGRTALATGSAQDVTKNLDIAASYPFTFYGQLALAQLGRTYDYHWQQPGLSEAERDDLLSRHEGVRRAIALAQIDRAEDAHIELRRVNGAIDARDERALMAVAIGTNLAAAQIEIALSSTNKEMEVGLYPVPAFEPKNGFNTDRALIYALMRQESKFQTRATSRVGARGLMQLMPRTASFISKDRSLRYGKGRDRLYDPSTNLEIGQLYVNHLIDHSAKGDLFHLAAAYNGGPGNLRRWLKQTEAEDPLLFIESIPNEESRDFVEKVLTNIWIYRDRLGQPSPTRGKVAAGELPLYEALDHLTHDIGS